MTTTTSNQQSERYADDAIVDWQWQNVHEIAVTPPTPPIPSDICKNTPTHTRYTYSNNWNKYVVKRVHFSLEMPFASPNVLMEIYILEYFTIIEGFYLWQPAYVYSPWSMSSYGKQIESFCATLRWISANPNLLDD